MEHSTMKMHASMMGANPTLRYLKPATFAILDVVERLRSEGTEAYATMDAGPNVKILCRPTDAELIAKSIQPHVEVAHILSPGPAPHVI